jgi:hypothetical protein
LQSGSLNLRKILTKSAFDAEASMACVPGFASP